MPPWLAPAVYRGEHRDGCLAVVTVDGQPLDPRFDLACLAPSGFAWGYRGAGPGQLALALLADTLGDRFALAHWDRFRDEVISQLGFLRPFTLTSDDIEAFRSGLPEAAALR